MNTRYTLLIAPLFSVLMLCAHIVVHAQSLDSLSRFSVDGMASIATTSDGRYIATAGYDSLIRIWDAETGAQVQGLPRNDAVMTLAFLPGDSTLISVGSRDSAFYVWNWRAGVVLRKEKLWRPLGQAIVTADRKTLVIWVAFPETQIEYWSIEGGNYEKVAYKGGQWTTFMVLDNSGTQLYEWSRAGVSFLTQFNSKSFRPFPDSTTRSFPGGFSPDGKRIVCGRFMKMPTVYDAVTLDSLFSLDSAYAPDPIYRAMYDPSGEAIITVGRTDLHNTIQQWSAVDGRYMGTLAVLDSVFWGTPWITFSSDGSHFIGYVNLDVGGQVVVWRYNRMTNDAPAVTGSAGVSMNVVPNPSSGSVRVSALVPHPGTVRYTLYDYAGRGVFSSAGLAEKSGRHDIDLDVSGLANGLYFLRMQSGSYSATASVIVHH